MTRATAKVSRRQTTPETSAAPRRMNRQVLIGIVIIFVGTILVYLPAIRSGYIWDDPDYVINNHTLRDWPGLVHMWTDPRSLPQWYPLVHTTFWVEYHLWGLIPTGYHIDNVLLHIASALLLWRILYKLGIPGAWLAGAIFAVHPVHVESVAWITERKNLLSGVFYFSSLLIYLKFIESGKRSSYYVSLLLFAAALLSKSVVATLPAAILVLIWWKRGRVGWADVVPLVPFFMLGAVAGLHTAYLETHHVGARSDRIIELNLQPLDRVVLAGRAIWFYAQKLVAPYPLSFIYPQWRKPDALVWWQWIFPVGVILVIVALVLNRNRIGRGPAAAVMIFSGTLFPALGFFNVYPMRFSYVADHFQYHASAALIALGAALLCIWTRRWGRVVLIPLALFTVWQATEYKDAETLWRATLAKNSNSWMVHTNLGNELVAKAEKANDEKLYAEAGQHYDRALQLAPDIHDTHADVASMLARNGNYDGAMAEYQAALKINPDFAPAHYGIGKIHEHQKNLDLAEQEFRKAIECSPDYPLAHYALARVLEQKGNIVEAVEHYRTAVTFMPEDADAHYNLGSLLIGFRNPSAAIEAVAHLREAVRIRPAWAEAWTNLGAAEYLSGHPEDAIRSLLTALRIKPDLVPARQMLQRIQGTMSPGR